MRKEGFKLQPVSHRVHWHLHQDPPSYSRCFSAILSLLSIPETYSSSYICCRMKPFTVFRVAKDKKKENQRSKLNWMCWIWVMYAWQFATPYVLKILLYCMHSNRRINKGGGENDMWKVIHLSCQRVIFATFKPRGNRSYSLSVQSWPRS